MAFLGFTPRTKGTGQQSPFSHRSKELLASLQDSQPCQPASQKLKGCFEECNQIWGWWQLKDVFGMFTPILGEMIHFDEHIFLKWVGSTTM